MAGIFSVSRAAVILAGVAAGAITSVLRTRQAGAPADLTGLETAVTNLEKRVASQEETTRLRFAELTNVVQRHEERLQDVPSTSQIVAAMENLLSKSMENLDQRLSAQAQSIEVLKTTVSQTDDLLEKV